MNYFFYAPDLDSVYVMGNPNPAFFGGEPIWNTAEKQGVRQRRHVCQGVVYRLGDQVCIQAAGLGVNGVDPPGGERFNLGCAHLHGGEVALYLAQQQVVLVHA